MSTDQHLTTVRHILDGTIGSIAITAPVWVQHIQEVGTIFMVVGGCILIMIRIAIAWREWRRGKHK